MGPEIVDGPSHMLLLQGDLGQDFQAFISVKLDYCNSLFG